MKRKIIKHQGEESAINEIANLVGDRAWKIGNIRYDEGTGMHEWILERSIMDRIRWPFSKLKAKILMKIIAYKTRNIRYI